MSARSRRTCPHQQVRHLVNSLTLALRHLHHNRILEPLLLIVAGDEAVGGRADGIRDIGESDAELQGLLPVHFPPDFRHRFLPVHVQVLQARYSPHSRHHVLCEAEQGAEVIAEDVYLHVLAAARHYHRDNIYLA